ncbi:hypothetical protein ACH4ND_23900 [Streptomyces sp. NPDC017179]|uniref:hypothetical protein n=1 Tax=Streptomyces sp. NPDC017179 TaxID=3364979 RepID=UPI00379C1B90
MNFSYSKAAATGGAVALILLTSSACSTGDANDAKENQTDTSQSPETARRSDSRDLTLPLDAYLLTTPEMQTISRARVKLITQCLEKFNVDYAGEPEGESGLTENERRYGLADRELAKRSGYHVPALERTAPQKLPSTTQKLLTGEVRTYLGEPVPSRGCLGQAQRELRELEMYPALEEAQRINAEGYIRSQDDPAVVAVTKKWSECMSGAGFKYPDPMSAINDKKFRTPKASKHEKDVALADATCKESTNVIGVWSSTESSHQQILIRKSLKTLKEGQRVKQRTLSIAKSVLSE